MEPLLFVMAILGCGESDAPCRQIEIAAPRYQSEAQCLADSEDQLLRRDDLLFPSLVAQCRPAGQAPLLLRGSDVTLPEPASARPAVMRIASADQAG